MFHSQMVSGTRPMRLQFISYINCSDFGWKLRQILYFVFRVFYGAFVDGSWMMHGDCMDSA